MKTWEMIKELTENPNKEFVRKSDRLHIKTNQKGELIWENGYEFTRTDHEWEEVKEPKEPVDFMTAVASGSRIRAEHDLVQEHPYYLLNYFCAMDEVVRDLTEYFSEDIREIIINGKWYIED